MIMILFVVGGGMGFLLPWIFNWDSDLMFVMLPIAVAIMVIVSVKLIQVWVRMIRTDINKMQGE
jgi:hypothetical protein